MLLCAGMITSIFSCLPVGFWCAARLPRQHLPGSDIDATLTRMKADASKAEANLQELKRAGTESWVALNGALAESRAAFDRANQSAWDALKRAATP